MLNRVLADQAVLHDITSRITVIERKSNNNILSESNTFKLHINDKADLFGLSDWFVQSVAEEAAAVSKNESLSTSQSGDDDTREIQ